MKNNKVLLALGVGVLALNPDLANAASQATPGTVAAMASSAEGNILAIKQLAMSVFYMIGLFLFGMGLFLLYKDQKTPNQGHAKNGFISIVIGVCLLLIPQLVSIVGTSVGVTGDTAKTALSKETGF